MFYVTVTSENGFDEYWIDDSEFETVTDYLLSKNAVSQGWRTMVFHPPTPSKFPKTYVRPSWQYWLIAKRKENKMHTYTLDFTGTMYIEAESAEQAELEMSAMLGEVASFYTIEVSE